MERKRERGREKVLDTRQGGSTGREIAWGSSCSHMRASMYGVAQMWLALSVGGMEGLAAAAPASAAIMHWASCRSAAPRHARRRSASLSCSHDADRRIHPQDSNHRLLALGARAADGHRRRALAAAAAVYARLVHKHDLPGPTAADEAARLGVAAARLVAAAAAAAAGPAALVPNARALVAATAAARGPAAAAAAARLSVKFYKALVNSGEAGALQKRSGKWREAVVSEPHAGGRRGRQPKQVHSS